MADLTRDSERIKKQALAFALQNRLDEARGLFEQAVILDPLDPDPLIMLATLQGKQGNYKAVLDLSGKALSLSPDNVNAHVARAQALLSMDQPEKAIISFEHALKLDPDNASVCNSLAAAFQLLDRLDEAIGYYKAAISIAPQYELAHANLGGALKKAGRLEEAVASYQAALGIRPDNAATYINMGDACLALGRLSSAEDCYRKSLSIQPGAAETHYYLASTLTLQGRLDEALSHFNTALELRPNHEDAIGGMADIYRKKGEFDRAYDLLCPLVEKGTTNVSVALNFASFCERFERCHEAILLLENILSTPHLSNNRQRLLHFSLGGIHDHRKEYERAFKHYRKGNALKAVSFDPETMVSEVARNMAFFTPRRLAALPGSELPSRVPVFIVGMPRSGTTLVEQILASHPAVYGAGELGNIFDIVSTMPKLLDCDDQYPACLGSLTQPAINEVSERYLDHLQELGRDSLRVTDKMPSNFLYLGLIELAFPEAHIIHCMRNPLDTCLSIYFQDFTGKHEYAYDLGNIGALYREYRRLMEHWKVTLTLPVLEVKYEDLVTDTEHYSRDIIKFCGLEWDDRCSSFFNTRRDVITASLQQVRKPVYTSSIGRHKHYEHHLGPLKKALYTHP